MKTPFIFAIIIIASSFSSVYSQDNIQYTQSDSLGLVEIPAENFSSYRPGEGSKSGETFSKETTVADFMGDGYMKANMEAGDGSEENAENINIKLSYDIDFVKTGTHYIWARVHFTDGNSDSFFYGFDGQVVGQISGRPYGTWRWHLAEVNIDVAEAGIHNVNIFGREPNALIDHIVITTDPSYDPSVVNVPNELTKIFVATDGNDDNDGTESNPLASIQKAQELAAPGDTVYIRGGTYQVREDQISEVVSGLFASITFLDKSGTEGNRIKYWAYPGETPVFNFSDVKPENRRVVGMYVTGDYIHIKGLELTEIQTTITEHTESYAIRSEGNHNIFENLSLHDNVGTGLRHFNGGHNLFLNIDAYRNWDNVSQQRIGDNNDGIGVHPNAEGVGNVIRGCRVWFNSDDGIDIIRADAAVEIDNSWAFYNGYSPDFRSLGDGTGFKAGGHAHDSADELPEVIPNHTIKFSIAARNKANGFYANHHLGGNEWYNNSAYQNSVNFNMLNRPSREDNENIDTDGYDHVMINNLSYLKGNGFRHFANIDTSKNTLETNSWRLNFSLSDADFKSLDISLLTSPRKADGSLPDVDFMRPESGSNIIDAGTDIGFSFIGSAPELGALEADVTTGLQNDEGSIPGKISLKQNYPNPFNPTTKIIYEVPNSGNVNITVYDLSGRKIKTLLNEVKNSGTHELQFDGSNLASGIYFYSLQMNGASLVKKMTLLK